MSRSSPDPIRVLHVDDEPDLGEMVTTFIERENERLTVETATSASEGLDRLDSGTVDCVVSDYDMPGRNGIEFLEAVREDEPGLPFILFTGKGSEEVASDAISAGVTDHLQKETGTDQYTILANRIVNAVERARAEHAQQATAGANPDEPPVADASEDAAEHGDECVTVAVGDLNDGFYVEDDGVAIPPEERERVFGIGYSSTTDGTGLGLSIVRRVAEAHEWEIAVTESDDGGTRFEITRVETDA